MTRELDSTPVTAELPPCGPCAFCGWDDARHRVADSVVGRVLAGESEQDVAADFDWTVPMVRAAVIAARSAEEGVYQDLQTLMDVMHDLSEIPGKPVTLRRLLKEVRGEVARREHRVAREVERV